MRRADFSMSSFCRFVHLNSLKYAFISFTARTTEEAAVLVEVSAYFCYLSRF